MPPLGVEPYFLGRPPRTLANILTNSVVGIATRYGLDDPGIESR